MSKNTSETKPSSSDTTQEPTESTPLVGKGKDGDNGTGNGGLSMNLTTMLLAGEIAGSGVLALPRAFVRTGWLGIPILLLLAAMAAFSGNRLADCWTLMEERDPDMRTRKRNPYAIIAEKTFGKTGSVVVCMSILVTLFGAAVVYLLMAAQIIEQIFTSLAPAVTYCVWILIVAGAMAPLMLFPTPKDFSYLGAIAFVTILGACMLYFIEMMNEIPPFVFRYGIHPFQDFFLAVGMMMFAFGGASTFPTIQNDMADKTKFGKSLTYSFIAITSLYLVIAITGYYVYGERASSNLALSLLPTPLTLVGNVMMSIHLICAFIILINPVCQEMEELYAVPRDSSGGRLLVRLSIMLAIMFIGESIPRFQSILALIGGSTIALLTFVLPPYCYLKLSGNVGTPEEGQTPTQLPGAVKAFSWLTIAVGIVAGIFATFSAVSTIFATGFTTPCYLR